MLQWYKLHSSIRDVVRQISHRVNSKTRGYSLENIELVVIEYARLYLLQGWTMVSGDWRGEGR